MRNPNRVDMYNQFWHTDWLKERNNFLKTAFPYSMIAIPTDSAAIYDVAMGHGGISVDILGVIGVIATAGAIWYLNKARQAQVLDNQQQRSLREGSGPWGSPPSGLRPRR